MGRIFQTYLTGDKIYTCNACRTHLASHEDIVSKTFQGRSGRAYLFDHVENIMLGNGEQRRLLTGIHLVADVSCKVCETIIGWKYLQAFESDQKYKEGKFIVERARIAKDNGW